MIDTPDTPTTAAPVRMIDGIPLTPKQVTVLGADQMALLPLLRSF